MAEAREIPFTMVKAHDVLGFEVINPQGASLGTIEEIVLDRTSGKVCYVVLTFGGILGLGNKLFALPWEVLTFDQAKDQFILNIDEAVLKNAPGFDKDHWPNVADRTWGEKIFSYYGIRPYWQNK